MTEHICCLHAVVLGYGFPKYFYRNFCSVTLPCVYKRQSCLAFHFIGKHNKWLDASDWEQQKLKQDEKKNKTPKRALCTVHQQCTSPENKIYVYIANVSRTTTADKPDQFTAHLFILVHARLIRVLSLFVMCSVVLFLSSWILFPFQINEKTSSYTRKEYE